MTCFFVSRKFCTPLILSLKTSYLDIPFHPKQCIYARLQWNLQTVMQYTYQRARQSCLFIYTRMVVMFAYRHAYHTIETSTSILQSGNWANTTVKAKVHSMQKTMIPIPSRVCVCVKWLVNSKILYNYAILQCSTCDFIIYVYITTCMYLCIRMQLVCDVSCSEVMFISSLVGLTCSWLLHMILKHMRTTIN